MTWDEIATSFFEKIMLDQEYESVEGASNETFNKKLKT